MTLEDFLMSFNSIVGFVSFGVVVHQNRLCIIVFIVFYYDQF